MKPGIKGLRHRGIKRRSAAAVAARAGAGSAFTLLEMLVAVGAVALIGLGLAKIFSATGGTLRAGRQISRFNDYAALMERTMRLDLERLTREGFLVIVNEEVRDPSNASNVNAGPLVFANQTNATRPRRIDQVMFFADGKFTSALTPLHPSRTPSGNSARIWYGHGLRQFSDDPPPANPPLPLTDDENDSAPWFGQPGPNQFAQDWTLLRHAAVLVQPRVAPPMFPTPAPAGLTPALWSDKEMQVDLAPAQTSLFWHVSLGEPPMMPATGLIRRERPLTSSGLVDLISTDLSEARSVIMDAMDIVVQPRPIPQRANFNDTNPNRPGIAPGENKVHFLPNLDVTPTAPNQPGSTSERMKRWMRYAMPAEPASPGTPGRRMRFQNAAPDYLGTLGSGGQVWDATEEFRRADQLMLSSSRLVPACTEFIVEWSFGRTHPIVAGDPRSGEIIWHGMERYADVDFDGQINRMPGATEDLTVQPYRGNSSPALRHEIDGVVINSNAPSGYLNDPVTNTGAPVDALLQPYELTSGEKARWSWLLRPQVIQETVTPPNSSPVLFTTFGYVEPSFAPGQALPSGEAFTATNQPPTLAMPWPRMIRVTMSLVEPGDPPSEERTFQFVFELPPPREGVN